MGLNVTINILPVFLLSIAVTRVLVDSFGPSAAIRRLGTFWWQTPMAADLLRGSAGSDAERALSEYEDN